MPKKQKKVSYKAASPRVSSVRAHVDRKNHLSEIAEKIVPNKETALELLQDAGIFTHEGVLSKIYASG